MFDSGGKQISSFKLCLQDSKGWSEIQVVPTGFRKLLNVILWFFGGAWRMLLWAATLLATVGLTLVATQKFEGWLEPEKPKDKTQIEQRQPAPNKTKH